ncbi:MAG: energy-coupling factor transporter transmembrane component T [Synergistes sp.]|nr:energy-coupling factor transporter transmembrane component T [Synergistes sp.]
MRKIEKIALGQYIQANSPIHRLDPRVKIIAAVLAMVSVFLTETFIGFLCWSIALTAAIHTSKIPFRAALYSVKPIIGLILITSLIHILFTKSGTVIFTWGLVCVTRGGIEFASLIALRLIAMILCASILTFTTTPAKLSEGTARLLSPLSRIGIPVCDISMMITIALRFIPTLFEEMQKIIAAQKSRGADFESGGLVRRTKAYIPVLIPLFVIMFRRADNLATAMEARGYVGGVERTSLHPLVWGKNENIALLICTAVPSAIIAAERTLFTLLG